MNNKENNNFYNPSQGIIENANVKEYDDLYRFSIENREKFWEEQAENLQWYQKWDKVLDSSKYQGIFYRPKPVYVEQPEIY